MKGSAMKWLVAMLLASLATVAQAQEENTVEFCKATAYLAHDIAKTLNSGLDPTKINFAFPNAHTPEEQERAAVWAQSLINEVVNRFAKTKSPDEVAQDMLQECLEVGGHLQSSQLEQDFIKTEGGGSSSGYDKHTRRAVCFEQIKRFDALIKLYNAVGYDGVLNTFPPEKEGFPREYAIEILNQIELIDNKQARDKFIEDKWWECIEKFGGSREKDA
jgi:hypothetical protein